MVAGLWLLRDDGWPRTFGHLLRLARPNGLVQPGGLRARLSKNSPLTVDALARIFPKGADNFNVNPFNMPITIGAGSNRMLLVGVAVDPIIPATG